MLISNILFLVFSVTVANINTNSSCLQYSFRNLVSWLSCLSVNFAPVFFGPHAGHCAEGCFESSLLGRGHESSPDLALWPNTACGVLVCFSCSTKVTASSLNRQCFVIINKRIWSLWGVARCAHLSCSEGWPQLCSAFCRPSDSPLACFLLSSVASLKSVQPQYTFLEAG